MKRKIFYGIFGAFLVFCAILFTLLFCVRPNPANEASLKIGYNVGSISHAPIMIAHDAGIFDKHKLKAELVPLKSGKEIKQALATGKIDVGSGGVTHFFIPIAKGAPIKIIALSTISPSSVFVNPNSNIKTFNDLLGKKISSQSGGSSNFALGYALKKEGIDIDKITFLNIEKTYCPIALMEKKVIDASVAGEYEEKLYTDYGAVLLEEWATKGYASKAFPRAAIAVNLDFMAKNKKIVELFIEAFIESQKFIKENPDEAAKMVAAHIEKGSGGIIKFSMTDVKESWRGGTKYVLWDEPNNLVELSKMAKEIGDIEAPLTLEQIFDLSFEKKLKDAQKEIYPTN